MTPFHGSDPGYRRVSGAAPLPNLSTIENLFIAIESHTNLFSTLLKFRYAGPIYDAAYDTLKRVELTDLANEQSSDCTLTARK